MHLPFVFFADSTDIFVKEIADLCSDNEKLDFIGIAPCNGV
jgi:hypothetical protein